MGKLLAFVAIIYITIRITRFLLSLGKSNSQKPQKSGPYFKETEIRDAEFTDVEDENE